MLAARNSCLNGAVNLKCAKNDLCKRDNLAGTRSTKTGLKANEME